jgi:hypothetical protein
MFKIELQKTEDDFTPKISILKDKSISTEELAVVIYFLHTGAYAEKLYELALAKLSEDKMIKVNNLLNNLLKLLGTDISSVSQKAELELAKKPIISSEGNDNS